MNKFFSAIGRFLYSIVKVISWFCAAAIAALATLLFGVLLAVVLVWAVVALVVAVVTGICLIPFGLLTAYQK